MHLVLRDRRQGAYGLVVQHISGRRGRCLNSRFRCVVMCGMSSVSQVRRCRHDLRRRRHACCGARACNVQRGRGGISHHARLHDDPLADMPLHHGLTGRSHGAVACAAIAADAAIGLLLRQRPPVHRARRPDSHAATDHIGMQPRAARQRVQPLQRRQSQASMTASDCRTTHTRLPLQPAQPDRPGLHCGRPVQAEPICDRR